MNNKYNRRNFIKASAITGLGLSVMGNYSNLFASQTSGKRVGIIGLDTSHSIAFTKTLNAKDADPVYKGYKVVAAYPQGSKDIESAVSRVDGYIKDIKQYGVEIVNSIDDLLSKVDVVLLESNDGRVHLEQALPVFKAGKRVFIDKPIAASLSDTIEIFNKAEEFNVPVFSSSSLRYMESAQEIVKGKVGKVLGADAFSPAALEKTHPDLLWYGIHGIEILFTVMGPGCKSVTRTHTEDTDVVVGIWEDGRVGTFRGTRSGKSSYGGTVYGEKGISVLGPFGGYNPLLQQIVNFFETGVSPINKQETLEIVAFAEAADVSKKKKGSSVNLESVFKKASK
ncbi:Gfo/Idh/MocA family protein [Albibacterium indicum]|uniref:Gfo/Idh/MocA family protein n=1 Tax=Albibacterium indicum TaxID=2292082 RepID=UPI000E4BFCA3|nr:Gfo/Idh/MocA family oxidoreductase [Pedobacter indicus]